MVDASGSVSIPLHLAGSGKNLKPTKTMEEKKSEIHTSSFRQQEKKLKSNSVVIDLKKKESSLKVSTNRELYKTLGVFQNPNPSLVEHY